ncbi:unnamed protein product [Effrenium voratum]|uniref:Uncharacterized protein n=1 Tax=Effrenium voratum TaxID=2562239 RepID=A0AA36N2X2_9DINO|nr:unnamed protein product [Effrenium voratum]
MDTLEEASSELSSPYQKVASLPCSSTSIGSVPTPRTERSGSTWGRRNLEAELRQLRMQLSEERKASQQLRAELQTARLELGQVKNEIDVQRDRDALLAEERVRITNRFAFVIHSQHAKLAIRYWDFQVTLPILSAGQVQEKQEKKALAAELAQIEKMRNEREKERQQRLKQAKGKSKAKRDEDGLPAAKAARIIRDLD